MKKEIYRDADVTLGKIANRGCSGIPAPKSLHGLVDFCIDNVKPEHTLLELGNFQCASTSVFIQFAKKVISVDINLPTGRFVDAVNESAEALGSELLFLQCSSLELVSRHKKDLAYDVLYIDTVHTEEHCTKELKSLVGFCNSSPKIIAGHDYHTSGVKSAVNNFFKRKPDKVYTDGSWVYHH